jgi:hypothetical protein
VHEPAGAPTRLILHGAGSETPEIERRFVHGNMLASRRRVMNRNQRTFVLLMLYATALLLPLIFLRWSNGHIYPASQILVFYTADNPTYPGMLDYWGIYTSFGLAGLLFGLLAPIGLVALATFLALGTPPETLDRAGQAVAKPVQKRWISP